MEKYIIDEIEQAKEFWEWIDEDQVQFKIVKGLIQIPDNNEEFELPKDDHRLHVEINKNFERIYQNQLLKTEKKFEVHDEPEEGLSEETLEMVTNTTIKNEEPYENDLIFGKDKTEGIVAVEVEDDKTIMFLNNGETKEIPNKYWFVGPRSGKSSTKLEGNLYYKHLTTYDDFEEFKEARATLYKYKADFYSIFDPQEATMVYNGITFFKGLRVDDVSVLSFDIEADGLIDNETNEPLVGNEAKVFMISNTFRKDGKITKKTFSEDDFESQEAMITAWCKFVQDMDPSVIVGHNIFGYDLPYLSFVYRMETGGDDLILGRNFSEIKYNTRPSKFRKDGSQSYDYFNANIFGRQLIDTMFLAIKYDFSRKYPSYGLKAIIEFEGLIKKNRQFYDAIKISKNWNDLEERKKIKKYGEDDSDDSLALYDLMIPQYFYYANYIPKPFQKINNSATGSQINSFLVRSYLQKNHSLPKSSEKKDYGGGISFGVPGIHEHVFKIDIKSMYPSIMMQYEVYDRDKDPKGNFLKMVTYFTKERFINKKLYKETKKRYYKDLSDGQKIFVNSCYGLLGSIGLLFNSPKLADFVTRTGRKIIEYTIKWATGKNKEYWIK